MKKIIKTIFTIIFIVITVFSIKKLIYNFSEDCLITILFAGFLFAMHMFAWIAPKKFYDLCWKINHLLPNDYEDYEYNCERGVKVIEIGDIVILILSIVIMCIPLFI